MTYGETQTYCIRFNPVRVAWGLPKRRTRGVRLKNQKLVEKYVRRRCFVFAGLREHKDPLENVFAVLLYGTMGSTRNEFRNTEDERGNGREKFYVRRLINQKVSAPGDW
jgi:hypothetical protein